MKSIIQKSSLVCRICIFKKTFNLLIVRKCAFKKRLMTFLNTFTMFLVIFKLSSIADIFILINSMTICSSIPYLTLIIISIFINKSTKSMWHTLHKSSFIIALIWIIIAAKSMRNFILNYLKFTFHSPL